MNGRIPQEAIEKDVIVTRPFFGMFMMQVCAYCETPPDRIVERANMLNPSGTEPGWSIIWGTEGELYANKAPVQCDVHPDRLHYLLEC